MQEPAACVSEQVTLQLVPWTCAWDDWQQEDLGQSPVVTCTPAYLQLSYQPGLAPCNCAQVQRRLNEARACFHS